MRIESQSIETNIQATVSKKASPKEATNLQLDDEVSGQGQQSKGILDNQMMEQRKEAVSKQKLQEAVESINEFLEIQQKSSKFIFHEGLDKYYVQLVDTKTEEVIKEIPPEKILDAFYEMQKLAGMIVDEKI